MNKKAISILILALAGIIMILHIPLTTRQGINYEVRSIKIPLYLKVLDFYDRDFNYRQLARRIIQGRRSDTDKIMALFEWTTRNIALQPKELPVVDDHVWHIIVRGYGTGDQFSDVFATLCNYAGYKAMFLRLGNPAGNSKISVALLKLKGKWRIFDPRTGCYFVNKAREFATREDILKGEWQVRLLPGPKKADIPDYGAYFTQLSQADLEETQRFSRPNLQSPFNRLAYALKKIFTGKRK
jgi:hypothetical protein